MVCQYAFTAAVERSRIAFEKACRAAESSVRSIAITFWPDFHCVVFCRNICEISPAASAPVGLAALTTTTNPAPLSGGAASASAETSTSPGTMSLNGFTVLDLLATGPNRQPAAGERDASWVWVPFGASFDFVGNQQELIEVEHEE